MEDLSLGYRIKLNLTFNRYVKCTVVDGLYHAFVNAVMKRHASQKAGKLLDPPTRQ